MPRQYARQSDMPRPRGFERGAGFLAPSYEMERREQELSRMQAENFARQQANDQALLIAGRYATDNRREDQQRQQAIEAYANEKRQASAKEYLDSLRSERRRGGEMQFELNKQAADYGGRLALGQQAGEQDIRKLAVDFDYRDKLARIQSQIDEQRDARVSGMNARAKEMEYLRNRSDALNKSLQDFAPSARRLTPEGKAEYEKFRKNLKALGSSPEEKGIDERLWLQQRSRLADELYSSGLGGEISPLGQMPGDYEDIGILRYTRDEKGNLNPIGPKPGITDEEINQYIKQLPGGGAVVMQPRAGMFSVVQPPRQTRSDPGVTLSPKDMMNAYSTVAKELTERAFNSKNEMPQPTEDEILREFQSRLKAIGIGEGPPPEPFRPYSPPPAAAAAMSRGETSWTSPPVQPPVQQPATQGTLQSISERFRQQQANVPPPPTPEAPSQNQEFIAQAQATGARYPEMQKYANNIAALLAKYPDQETLLREADEHELASFYQSVSAMQSAGRAKPGSR